MSTGIKLYIGNLSWNTDAESLRAAFEKYGAVTDSFVVKDRETGRSKGFGFITYETNDEAQAAIDGLNESDLDGRTIRVNLANARPPRTEGGGRGYGGDRGYGGRDGGYGGRNGGYGGGRGYGDREGGRSYGDRDGGRSYDRRDGGRRDYGGDRGYERRERYDKD